MNSIPHPQHDASATLSVDIGNTRTHLGIITREDRRCHATTAFPTVDIHSHLIAACTRISDQSGKHLPDTAVIASVVEGATGQAAALLSSNAITPFTLRNRGALPISLKCQPVEHLGTDRIANALFAHSHYPESAIIICMGTAITLDIITGSTFHGGAILPGLRLQFESLAEHTDALPAISLEYPFTPPELPAGNTVNAITAGVLQGTAGAINRIVTSYKKSPGSAKTPVIGTGGDWDYFAPYAQFTAAPHPAATLIGTGLLLPYCEPVDA